MYPNVSVTCLAQNHFVVIVLSCCRRDFDGEFRAQVAGAAAGNDFTTAGGF
jgi:hypothetical protein